MSRGDEVRTTAYNVLHAAFGQSQCAIKIAAFGLSYPIVRRLTPTSKRSKIPAVAMMLTGIAGYKPMRNTATRFESRSHLR